MTAENIIVLFFTNHHYIIYNIIQHFHKKVKHIFSERKSRRRISNAMPHIPGSSPKCPNTAYKKLRTAFSGGTERALQNMPHRV